MTSRVYVSQRKKHSQPREASHFVSQLEELKEGGVVEHVGVEHFFQNSRQKKAHCKVQYFNPTTNTFRLRGEFRDFGQYFFVRVKPENKNLFELFLHFYNEYQ